MWKTIHFAECWDKIASLILSMILSFKKALEFMPLQSLALIPEMSKICLTSFCFSMMNLVNLQISDKWTKVFSPASQQMKMLQNFRVLDSISRKLAKLVTYNLFQILILIYLCLRILELIAKFFGQTQEISIRDTTLNELDNCRWISSLLPLWQSLS